MSKLPKNAKPGRNEELVLKRFDDPKKWGWGALGTHYGIGRQFAKDIFERDASKYLTDKQFKEYRMKLIRLKVGV